MRPLNGKRGLRRSQFAKEIKGADLEKVLIVSFDVSKVLQKSTVLNIIETLLLVRVEIVSAFLR